MISFNTYYCPQCKQGIESKDCEIEKTKFHQICRCKKCKTKITTSGSSLIVVGLLIIFFMSMVLCCGAPQLGLIIGTPLIIIGVLRIIKQMKRKNIEPENGTDT